MSRPRRAATTSAASDVRHRPPTATPMPTIATAYSPSPADPSIGRPRPTPPDRGAEADPGGEQHGRHDRRPRTAAMPPAITQRARDSRRRQDHLETAVGLVRCPLRDERRAAKPAAMKNSCTYELEERRRPTSRSKSGKIVLETPRAGLGLARDLGRPSGRPATRAARPSGRGRSPTTGPAAAARRSARLIGPRTPRTTAGLGSPRPGRDAEVAAQRTARRRSRGRPPPRSPTSASAAQSNSPTSAMWFGGPAERAQRRERPEDIQAVGDPQRRHRDARRRPPRPRGRGAVPARTRGPRRTRR